jgi:aarF domain-containing kinase
MLTDRKLPGLYLKVGQAIAMQAAVLPPAFQKKFAKLFDDAPQESYNAILKVFKQEYGGKTPDEVFLPGSFEHKAVASASIAQVHRAKLKDGTPVAIKIQKPQIATWIHWDLKSYQ